MRRSTKPSILATFLKPVALVIFTALLGACASGPDKHPNARPDWIDNPGEGAIGSSTTHVKGRHYQEELAIARAREKLAARLGVTVSSIQTVSEKVRNSSLSTSSDKDSTLVVDNNTVRAQVRDTWYDVATDTVWVVVDPL